MLKCVLFRIAFIILISALTVNSYNSMDYFYYSSVPRNKSPFQEVSHVELNSLLIPCHPKYFLRYWTFKKKEVTFVKNQFV